MARIADNNNHANANNRATDAEQSNGAQLMRRSLLLFYILGLWVSFCCLNTSVGNT